MTTMNREEQKQVLIDTANHVINRDNTSPYSENLRELARIALASLEAEPVAYIFKHPAGKLFCALTDESNKEQSDVIPVYAAAPALVVPDNASEYLAYAYKVLTPEIMLGHIAVFERYGIAPNDSSTTIHALRIALDGIERSNAMLNGDEPVSQPYMLPAEAAYGYFAFNDHHGEEFFKKREDAIAFCKEAIEEYRQENAEEGCDLDEVRRTCWGIIMQEGIDIEVDSEGHIDYTLTPELAGNSPVTPDGWVIVPKKLTAENGAKGVLSGEFSETTFISCPECFGDDDCDTCDGSGRIEIKVPVTWTTIKSIWDKGIAYFAAEPPQEVNRG
ncbi:DUF551 domain-containing protein [Escherichia coli]